MLAINYLAIYSDKNASFALSGGRMTNIDVIRQTLARMDDDELLARWKSGLFSDDAAPLARAEMALRGMIVSQEAHPSEDQGVTRKNKGARAWLVNTLLFVVCVVVTGVVFSKGNPLHVISVVITNPTIFLDVFAEGLGTFLVFFAIGGIAEMAIALISRRRPAFRYCLMWAAGVLFLVFFSTFLSKA